MRLRDILNPADGLFSNMPQDIWGNDFDPSFMDIELFTRIGGLDASPLARHYVHEGILDTETLAALLYQRYGNNWRRIWEALLAEYDIMLTSTLDETRSIARDSTDLQTRDLSETRGETLEGETLANSSNVKSGSINRANDSETTHNVTDLETRNLTSSAADSGNESVTDTYDETFNRDTELTLEGSEKLAKSEDETNSGESTLTYAGSEKLTKNEDETNSGESTLTKSGSEIVVKSEEETRGNTKTNSGTVSDSGAGTQTGTGNTATDKGLYGVGGSGLTNESRDTANETRDFADTKTNTRTDNLTETESGNTDTDSSETTTFTGRSDKTVDTNSKDANAEETKTFTGRNDKTVDGSTRDVTGEEIKSFIGRIDSTEEEETHTGTKVAATTFGKQTTGSDSGTVSGSKTGTEGTSESASETYDDLTEANDGTESRTEQRNQTGSESGTVGNVGNEQTLETFHSEGSSPLRTYQALITEEIEGRSGQAWNFTDIVIRDVQEMIASKIWRRTHGTI